MKTRHAQAAAAFLVLGSLVAAALAVTTPAQSRTGSTQGTTGSIHLAPRLAPACPSAFGRQPLVVYDRTGSTLVGPVHCQLSVYADGLATYSRIDFQDPDGRVLVRTLLPGAVDALVDALLAAGADVLCDDPTPITDVPLATVTVLEGRGADAAAHTFSYYAAPSNASALVESIVQEFIAVEIGDS